MQKRKHLMGRILLKRIAAVCIALVVMCSAIVSEPFTMQAYAKTPTEASGFNGMTYKDWCQSMSKYSGMRDSGCRVTAYAKMIAEAGYTQVTNPDKFFEWARTQKTDSNKPYFDLDDAYENTSFGVPLTKYITKQGGNIKLITEMSIVGKKKTDIAKTIMGYLNKNSKYYCILSCMDAKNGFHTSYVGRADSLAAKTPVLLDSAPRKKGSGTYGNIVKYTDYTSDTFTKLRIYEISAPVKGNPVFTVKLDPANNTSAQTFYVKYGKGIYKDKACKTALTKVAVPKLKNYTFQGYYTGKNGAGTQCINASGKITCNNKAFTKNATLYAYWKKVETITGPKIAVTSSPTTLKAGSSFGLRGTITAPSSAKLTRVNSYVINSKGKTVLSAVDKVNTTSFNIQKGNINQQLKFGKLGAGTYTLKITATNAKETKSYTKKFVVIAKPKLSMTSAPSSIKKGSSYGLRGTITAASNAKITKVNSYIIDSKGKTVQSAVDKVNTTSFNVQKGKINQNLKFGKLAKGTYTLKITATNAAGTTTYTKKFTVK